MRTESPMGSDGDGQARATGEHVALVGVAAHRLLTSSSVVSMGISTVLRLWETLPDDQRRDLLTRMASHAAAIDEGLKLLVLGHEAALDPPPLP